MITPGDALWDMVEPEDILKESDNITANIIHDALYSSSPEVGAVVHVHSPAAKAVSCLEEGFIYLNQEVGMTPSNFLRPSLATPLIT